LEQGWRQRLYEKRQGQQQQWSILQWMQTGVSDLPAIWLGSVELQSVLKERGSKETALPTMVRKLTITGQPYELRLEPKGNIETTYGALNHNGTRADSDLN